MRFWPSRERDFKVHIWNTGKMVLVENSADSERRVYALVGSASPLTVSISSQLPGVQLQPGDSWELTLDEVTP